MDTKTKLTKSQVCLLIVGLGLIALSAVTATPVLMRANVVPEMRTYAIPRQQALDARTMVRLRERRYWDAVDIYRELHKEGVQNLPRLDVNDPESYELYFNEEFIAQLKEASHGAAEANPFDELAALPERDRDLLEGYRNAGICPEVLKRYRVEGAYDLCVRLLEATEAMGDQRAAAEDGQIADHDLLGDQLDALDGAADRENFRSTDEDYRPSLR